MRILGMFLAIWFLSCQSVIAQYNTKSTVQPIEGLVYEAEAADLKKTGDKVTVLLQKPGKPLPGALIKVTSKAKWINVLGGSEFANLKALPEFKDGWLLSGEPAKYLVMILESDPEGAPSFKTLQVTLGKPPAEPEDPKDPPKEDVGLEKHLKSIAAEVAKTRDFATAKKLAEAYQGVANRNDLGFDAAKQLAINARRNVLAFRGNNIDWRLALTAIDTTFKAADPKTVAEYFKVLRAVADVLAAAGTQKVQEVCKDGL